MATEIEPLDVEALTNEHYITNLADMRKVCREPPESKSCSWLSQLVAYTMQLGFQKVTIISRENWQPVGYSDPTHIATAWTDPEGNMVNENQELLNDWNDKSNPSFSFYQTKFNIILRDPDETGNWIVAQTGKQVCVAAQLTKPNIYFIAAGMTKSKGKKVEGEVGFPGAPGALTAIQKHVWDALYEYQDGEDE